eukprot:587064-Prymnesium_polylepis.1
MARRDTAEGCSGCGGVEGQVGWLVGTRPRGAGGADLRLDKGCGDPRDAGTHVITPLTGYPRDHTTHTCHSKNVTPRTQRGGGARGTAKRRGARGSTDQVHLRAPHHLAKQRGARTGTADEHT